MSVVILELRTRARKLIWSCRKLVRCWNKNEDQRFLLLQFVFVFILSSREKGISWNREKYDVFNTSWYCANMGQSATRNFKIAFVVAVLGTTLVVLVGYQNIQKVKKNGYFNMDNNKQEQTVESKSCFWATNRLIKIHRETTRGIKLDVSIFFSWYKSCLFPSSSSSCCCCCCFCFVLLFVGSL